MLYKGHLGELVSCADISYSQDIFSGEANYRLSTTIKAYDGVTKWPGETSVDDICAKMAQNGWDCTVSKDGYNRPKIHCIHRETQAAIDAIKLDQDKKFKDAERGYIRFGKLPNCGKSRNHRDNTLERGVSCFEAEFSADGSYRLLLTPVLQVTYLTVFERDAYRLYGECVGSGADGEPVLRVDSMEVIP